VTLRDIPRLELGFRYQSKASRHFAQPSLSRMSTTWRKNRQHKNEQIC